MGKPLHFVSSVVKKNEARLPTFFFWLFMISFFIDRVTNYFVHFPFFVIAGIILFPFLLAVTLFQSNEKKQLITLIVSFATIAAVDSIVFLFDIKNISDLLFIVLFFVTYYYYKNNIKNLKIATIYLFMALAIVLFSFTFIGSDSSVYGYSGNNKSNIKIENKAEEATNEVNNSNDDVLRNKNGTLQFQKHIKLDNVESRRAYHYGLFRLPHVASYFFGFLALFYFYLYYKKRRLIYLVFMIITLFICLYSGSRTIVAALMLSGILFLFKRKYIIYLILVAVLATIIVASNNYFLHLTRDTFLFQYFSFIKTTLFNFTRLSRYRIWYSWWTEVKQFNLFEILIGKGFINALLANQRNLNYSIWFHNDFQNIFYSYGLIGLSLYVGFFVKIYRDFKSLIRQNIFLFIFYSTMVVTAIINGFYYYFPVFILYLFFLIIKNEKQIV